MLRMFSTINGQVEQIEKPENGSWLCLSEPTDVELATVSQQTGVDLADLRAPLDDEERSRIDVEDDYTMIIVDIPTVEERGGRDWYETIPLSIIVTEDLIITVCMQDTPVLHPFMEGTIRGFNTFMRSRFILQILYRNASTYLRYLRIIDRESDKLEFKLRHAMQNREIMMLLELSKTLVYFTTSLKSNEIVMEKLTTLARIQAVPGRRGPARRRHHREQAGHRDGEHLQRRSREHDRRLRLDRLQQPEQRDAHLHDHLHHAVDPDADLLHVRHELRAGAAGHAVHRQDMRLHADHRDIRRALRRRRVVPDPFAHVQMTGTA